MSGAVSKERFKSVLGGRSGLASAGAAMMAAGPPKPRPPATSDAAGKGANLEDRAKQVSAAIARMRTAKGKLADAPAFVGKVGAAIQMRIDTLEKQLGALNPSGGDSLNALLAPGQMEKLAAAAAGAAGETEKTVGDLLKSIEPWKAAAAQAQAAEASATAAVAAVPRGKARSDLETRLAAPRLALAAAMQPTSRETMATAATGLPAIAGQFSALARSAGQVNADVAKLSAMRAKVDVALDALKYETAKLGDGAAKTAAQQKIKEFAAQGATLDDPGADTVTATAAAATRMVEQIEAAAKQVIDARWADANREWDRCAKTRTLIGSALPIFIEKGNAAAPKLAELVARSEAVRQQLAALKADRAKPLTVIADWMQKLTAAQTEFPEIQRIYEAKILEPVVMPDVERRILEQPDGPEAEMKQALTPGEFKRRLLDVSAKVKVLGSNVANILSPGEMLGVSSYTNSDYTAMNKVLRGDAVANPAEKKSVERKIGVLTKALAKLPASPMVSRRGETWWPGADVQYVEDNEFQVQQFWSTGVGFSLPGAYQITITGKTGRDVSDMSDQVDEKEILFPPGARFRVTRCVITERMPDNIKVKKALIDVEEI
jgi:hypothetical protein